MNCDMNRVIVITGASSGIGAELARRVGANGDKPVLVARRTDLLAAVAAESGGDALALTADVTVRAEVEAVVAAAIERHGHIDVWVNNAGRGITRPVLELTDEDLDDMLRINVKSALYGIQAVVPHMRARGSGHIINVSSMLGRIPFASMRSAYSAAKHALMSLTANLRVDLAQSAPGIHVSAFIPGVVATEFGSSALHGGIDSRQMPTAQPVSEAIDSLVDCIDHPRAEVFSRPGYKQQVRDYYAADDLAEVERRPPFTVSPAAAAAEFARDSRGTGVARLGGEQLEAAEGMARVSPKSSS